MATFLRRSLTVLMIVSVLAILYLLFFHRAETSSAEPRCEPVVDIEPGTEGRAESACGRARDSTLAWALIIVMTVPFQIWARSRYPAPGVEPFIGRER